MENSNIKVLVVEDEHIILKYIAQKLSDADSDVEIIGMAEDAPFAMEVIRNNPPDILFTDISMPGMDGLELIGWVKKHFPGLYVVVISGYSNFEYAQAALRFGVFDYLLKPIDCDALKNTLENLKTKILAERKLEEEKQQSTENSNGQAFNDNNEIVLPAAIKEYIDLYFNKPLSLAQLSEQFNYSQVYINRIFRDKFSVSPMKYQMQIRINTAKKLLEKHNKADIKDIASAVGYDDARYFSRVFKQLTGLSPSEFQLNISGNSGGIAT